VSQQLSLPTSGLSAVRAARESKLAAEFLAFHEANPKVYEELVKLARQAKAKGRTTIGIGMLWEVLRWHFWLETKGDDEFKLNNNHRSRYARLIMGLEVDLAGVFVTRELRS
jgi:hypothetical protein